MIETARSAKGLSVVVVVVRLAELAVNREILGSIPAPSKLFSMEPVILKILCIVSALRRRIKHNHSHAALIGLKYIVFGLK